MADQNSIITKAREITGNKASVAVGETMIPDAAIEAALAPLIRDLVRVFGDSSTSKEQIFTAIAQQQDYKIATYVGTDVYSISEVIRSTQFIADSLTDTDEIDPSTGLPRRAYGFVKAGGQGDVFDKITSIRRKQWLDKFSWEVVRKADGDYLRLYEIPTTDEAVAVRYLTSGFSIETLPSDTEPCLVWAACVAIIDAEINRIMSDRKTTSTWGEAQAKRLALLEKQRDRYENLYRNERDKLQ